MNRIYTLLTLTSLFLLMTIESKAFSITTDGSAEFKVLCVDTTSSELTIDVCSDSFTLNGITYKQDGIHKQKFTNAAGCDSTVYLMLTLKAERPVISVDQLFLATTRSYETYQWLKNDTAISGATNAFHKLLPPLLGCYSVVVNEAFCPDTSDYYCIDDVKVEEQSLENQVKLYPNPTTGIVTISAPIPVWTQIYALDGRVVQTNQKTNKLSLENLSSGIYFIRINDEKGKLITIEQVVKE